MSQIKTKGLEDNAVNGQKLRLQNNEYLRARNAANSSDVSLMKLRTDNVIEFPTAPQHQGSITQPKDMVTFEFLENYAMGRKDAKDAVRVASESNLALSGGLSLTVDGIALVNGDRVGLVGQTNPAENGIYVVSGIGAAYALTRALDMNESEEATQGLYFKVSEGTTRALWEYVLTTQDPIVLGTTALSFSGSPTAAAISAGDMLKKTGNVFEVDLASLSGLESTNPGNAAGQLKAKVSGAALHKDKTTGINSAGELAAIKSKKKSNYTLIASDITNGYVDLLDVAADGSLSLNVKGLPPQLEGVDYSVNYTGGAGSKTRVTFIGDLAAAGAAALAAGDVIEVDYKTLDLA